MAAFLGVFVRKKLFLADLRELGVGAGRGRRNSHRHPGTLRGDGEGQAVVEPLPRSGERGAGLCPEGVFWLGVFINAF